MASFESSPGDLDLRQEEKNKDNAQDVVDAKAFEVGQEGSGGGGSDLNEEKIRQKDQWELQRKRVGGENVNFKEGGVDKSKGRGN